MTDYMLNENVANNLNLKFLIHSDNSIVNFDKVMKSGFPEAKIEKIPE